MSGHSVQRTGRKFTPMPGQIPGVDQDAYVHVAEANRDGLRVTIMLDPEDQAPPALDRIMAEVRQTIDRYIEARKR